MTHLRSHHVGFKAATEECAKKGCTPIRSMFVHKDAADTYGVVDGKICVELAREKFVLVFDGFTDAAKHAIAIFAVTKKGVRIIAFSPFPDFDRGLAKIQDGGDFTLLRNERKALNRLLREPQDQPRTVGTSSTPNKSKRKSAAEELDEKISKKARKRSTRQSKYLDASWIPATSVVVERFFSTVASFDMFALLSLSSKLTDCIPQSSETESLLYT
ncbi:hypothetical protein PF011_g15845 [Phytophthora fragariae]|uniref:Uncharacterized protein n=1 Tax=Phytophthora fragariae TaxID=53985 RepID=A0A6A3JTE7_9STRA|nr:hypothetical protein PF011_g15845 [Phytophthora fragariae]